MDDLKTTAAKTLTDVRAISSSDKSVGDQLIEIKKKLLVMKKEVNSSAKEQDKVLPFASDPVARAGKQFILCQIQLQIDLASLLLECLEVKQHLLKEKPLTDAQLLDIQRMSVWLGHVSKLHSNNMEGIYQALHGFVNGVEGRAEHMSKLFENQLQCPAHNMQAISRSFDNKKLYCKKCIEELDVLGEEDSTIIQTPKPSSSSSSTPEPPPPPHITETD
jgi:hypothetical protein